jgi:heterotetrameric sarcosine oxidase gamma subunit
VLERQSALAGALRLEGCDDSGGRRRLRLGEVRGWRLVQLAAFPATVAEVERAVRPLLGVDLPAQGGLVITAQKRQLMKTGPEAFWVVTHEAEDLTVSLRAAVRSALGAVTPLSNSRTRIYIEGPDAPRVLSMGIPLDFQQQSFRVDHFALTGLHHTSILVHRSGEERYELYALRSFALWTWEWLTDAALQFGYDIGEPA